MKNRYLALLVIMSMWCMAIRCPTYSNIYEIEHNGTVLATDSLHTCYYYNKDSVAMELCSNVEVMGNCNIGAEVTMHNQYAHTVHLPDTAFSIYMFGEELETHLYFAGCAEERVLQDSVTGTYAIFPKEQLNFLISAESYKRLSKDVIDENADTLNAVFIIQGMSIDGKVLAPDTFNLYPFVY